MSPVKVIETAIGPVFNTNDLSVGLEMKPVYVIEGRSDTFFLGTESPKHKIIVHGTGLVIREIPAAGLHGIQRQTLFVLRPGQPEFVSDKNGNRLDLEYIPQNKDTSII
jgi:hypothetical protein